jgi:N-carbamoylputrescine amidase
LREIPLSLRFGGFLLKLSDLPTRASWQALAFPAVLVYAFAMPECRSRRFTLGLVQMACSPDPRANTAKAAARVREAARRGADVVCLQELFRSPYFCQREDAAAFDFAEPVPGPATRALAAVARKARVVVIVPVFERRAAGVFHNSAAVLDADGSLAGVYRKMHIPDDPGYYEKFYFTPGDLGFRAFDTCVGRIAVLICWDQWFPEAARLAALQGASVLFYPTAIGWHPDEKARHGEAQRDAWITVQRGHAVANGCYVAAVNRVGLEKPAVGGGFRPRRSRPGGRSHADGAGLEFWGSSFVADPQGVIVAQASADREEILLAEVDPARIEDVRRHWPFLRDRRIDAYQGLDRRYLDDNDGIHHQGIKTRRHTTKD